MPRTGRGGARTGAPGTAYQNRTDLTAAPKPVPVTTVPGQEYGQATAQAAAQRAVPMGNAPLNGPVAGGPPTPPGASPAATPQPPSLGLPPGLPAPGSLPPLSAPTDRPDEHLMTGVPSGPGAGSEALQPLIVHPQVQAAAALNMLGPSVSPQLKAVRDAINATLTNQATP